MRKAIAATFLSIAIVGWITLIFFVRPEEILNAVGVTNGYISLFVIAFIGGTSIMFPLPYYLLVATFAAGGANIFLIGLVAGLGVVLGDSTSYFVGYKGKEVLPKKADMFFNRIFKNINPESPFGPVLFFIYGACVPLSNDLLVVPMGMAKYPFFKLIIPFAMGNVVFNTMIAFLAASGYNFLF